MSSPYDGLVDEPTPQPEPHPAPNQGEIDMGKGLLRSKTFWVNILTAVASVATYVTNSDLLTGNPEMVAIIGTGVGIVNVLLRLITKEPITSVK